ncbi:helix-turn-helix transcriptional regulator [Alcaligenaceae bacterium]|nr:helix-turn-helix transcriptional regulator [Alcaligenaceae bacterium]
MDATLNVTLQGLLSGQQALPRPLYGRARSLPNQVIAYRHSHPWVQLSYALHGVVEVETDWGRFIAPPQRAIWVPAHIEHKVRCTADTRVRSLYVDPAVVPWGAAHCRVLVVDTLLRELIRRFSQLPVFYDEAGSDGRLAGVLLDQLESAPEADLMLPFPQDARLKKICSHLQEDPCSRIALRQWSSRLSVSEKTLSRIFVQQTGLSFRLWRQRLRLLSALPLLERGDRVTDVALACGYDSLSAFIAAFRQQFGATPGEFFAGGIDDQAAIT